MTVYFIINVDVEKSHHIVLNKKVKTLSISYLIHVRQCWSCLLENHLEVYNKTEKVDQIDDHGQWSLSTAPPAGQPCDSM